MSFAASTASIQRNSRVGCNRRPTRGPPVNQAQHAYVVTWIMNWESSALYAHRIERTQWDARLDDVELYHAVFQVFGRSTVLQNDQAVTLDVGDVALVDSTRPVAFVNDPYAQYLSLSLPRRSLMSHLGLEPQGGSVGRHGTRAARLLFQLVLDEFKDERASDSASVYMQLAVYDLIGEIFTTSDPKSVSLYTDKQFGRVRAIIKDRFANPDLRPRDVAAEAGISLRYLQKLFTQRGSTCSGFIDSLRLDKAGRLLRRRAMASTRQPISEIAYASGFNDYNYFSQKFRRRFGYAPSAHARNGTAEVKSSKASVYLVPDEPNEA
ncbi:MAG TPA: helix-turn-helix domain-containing protein [Steroidobacteraceae bacterium]|nr:helix-turn-helix domain-containing protein [Steroidobacteraceae bacterium]